MSYKSFASRLKHSRRLLHPIALFALAFGFQSVYSAPRSAIITLGIPSGARQLGMGETGVALAEDAFATYWNPAAQAFKPLADEWSLSMPTQGKSPRALTSRRQPGFLGQSEAYAAIGSQLYYFNGTQWVSYFETDLEGNLKIQGVVRRFRGSDEELDSAVATVKAFNELKTREDEDLAVRLRIPWSLVLKDSITTLFYDVRGEKLWVGTAHGLQRFDGAVWKSFHELNNKIVYDIASQGNITWIATSEGLYRHDKGELQRKGTVLPGQDIRAVRWSDKTQELYVAVQGQGIARLSPARLDTEKDQWALYTLNDGLQSLEMIDLELDGDHVWVAHPKGASHFNRKKWDQLDFGTSEVRDIAVSEKSEVWFATSTGLLLLEPTYALPAGPKSEIEAKTAEGQRSINAIGEWQHFHTGKGLHSDQIFHVALAGPEIWLTTAAGVEKLEKADMQLAAFYENLLPSLQINDLYHFNTALTIPLYEWGTIGWYFNFVSFGESVLETENATSSGTEVKVNSLELVTGLTYGLRIDRHNGVGIAFKLIYSDLISGVPNEPDAKTTSYAVDVSYLARDVFVDGLNFGLVAANMGPQVYYVDKSKQNPIPLMWKVGVSYDLYRTPEHRVVIAVDYKKDALTEDDKGDVDPFYTSLFKTWSDPSLNTAMINSGIEYTYNNTLALRMGYLFDDPGQREELDMGVGLMISDILQFDFALIKDLSGNGVRDGQTRYSMLFNF